MGILFIKDLIFMVYFMDRLAFFYRPTVGMSDPADALLAAFAAVLRRHRRAAGLTQEALAHDAALSPRYISLLENCHHQPTPGTLGAIARRLDMPLATLIAEVEAEAGAMTGDAGRAQHSGTAD